MPSSPFEIPITLVLNRNWIPFLAYSARSKAESSLSIPPRISSIISTTVTFTPNDQSSAYRFSVYTAENYDADPEAIKAELCSEPPMPMSNWFFYEEITTDYQINPNTEAVIIAAAKNVNNEWGPVTEVRFTTPAEAAPAAAPAKAVRLGAPKAVKQAGVVPAIKNTQIKLKAL